MNHIIIDKPGEHNIHLEASGEYRIDIVTERAEALIYGTFLAENKDAIDIHLTICHKAPHTRANTILKGVARDSASIRFFGLIKIEKNCGDTQSFLEERVLLLSDKARAEAVPELEILSDDVKCSHAASISKIPEEHLFYLQSRGIDRRKAEGMIVDGFLDINPSMKA